MSNSRRHKKHTQDFYGTGNYKPVTAEEEYFEDVSRLAVIFCNN